MFIWICFIKYKNKIEYSSNLKFEKKLFDKFVLTVYNNHRKWRNHKRGSPSYCFDTSNSGKFTDVSVLLVYSYVCYSPL